MRRKLGLILVFGAMLPLALASAAWACGVLATLTLDKKVAAPGDAVTASGRNYGTNVTNSAVSIRLKNRSGDVIATTTPAPSGRITQPLILPNNLSPGWYVVVATQTNANGTPKSGTPGRTTLRIAGAASAKSAEVAGAPWGSSTPSGPAAADGGSGPVLALLLGAALSLTMLAGGWRLLGRRSRSVAAPQFGV